LTEVDTIGTSRQGRPILAIGVAGSAKALGTRPEALFTSLTHAREPESMQSALHFLLALLDGYGTDPVLTYLVDEREIWFIPVVNPDGYAINEATWLSGGGFGFWRKNARDNDGDGIVEGREGVDLNRNFGYQWGYDNVGSSPNPSSDVYRGPAAFSEPETQTVRDFCAVHAFRTADNLHTYYEASLYPWGYIAADTPDSAAFVRLGDAKTEVDRYGYGRSGQLLYPVNGDANDWMYGDVSKPKALAYTTEIGDQNDGFWPVPSRILPLAELTMPSHVATVYAAGVYVVAESLHVEDSAGVLRPGDTSAVRFALRHLGATGSTSGGVTVNATSSHPAVTLVDGEALFPDLAPGEESWPLVGGSLVLHADAAAVPGDVVPLYLEITDAAGYVGRDTLSLRLGEPTVVFADSGNASFASWVGSGGWGLEAVDGDSAFADSPMADYPAAAVRLPLPGPDLSGAAARVMIPRPVGHRGGVRFRHDRSERGFRATWTPVPVGGRGPATATGGYAEEPGPQSSGLRRGQRLGRRRDRPRLRGYERPELALSAAERFGRRDGGVVDRRHRCSGLPAGGGPFRRLSFPRRVGVLAPASGVPQPVQRGKSDPFLYGEAVFVPTRRLRWPDGKSGCSVRAMPRRGREISSGTGAVVMGDGYRGGPTSRASSRPASLRRRAFFSFANAPRAT
jgi:hypothetical protein